MLPDYPITPEKKKEIMLYRQGLRDITKSKECPYNIDLNAKSMYAPPIKMLPIEPAEPVQ